jgi:hypothetical protein
MNTHLEESLRERREGIAREPVEAENRHEMSTTLVSAGRRNRTRTGGLR